MRDHIFAGVFYRRPLLGALLALAIFLTLSQATRQRSRWSGRHYTSTAKVLVRSNEAAIRLTRGTVLRPDEDEDPVLGAWFADLGSIRRLVKRDTFLEKVSERLGGEFSVKKLKNRIQAFPRQMVSDASIFEALGGAEDLFFQELEEKDTTRRRTRWIQFSAVAQDPKASQRIVSATLEVFLEEARQRLAGDAIERRRDFEELKSRLTRRLDQTRRKLEKALKDTEPENRDPDSVRFRLQMLLQDRGRRLTELEKARSELQRQLPARTVPSVSVLESRRQTLAARLEELKTKFNPGSRKLVQAQESLDALERVVESGVDLYTSTYHSGLEVKMKGLKSAIKSLDDEIKILENSLPNQLERRELNSLRKEVLRLESTLGSVEVKIFKLKLEERRSLEKGSLMIIKEPESGTRLSYRRSSDPARGSLPGLAVCSLVLTFVILTLWEFLFLRETLTARVEQYLECPVLGVVPPRRRELRRKWERWKAEVKS